MTNLQNNETGTASTVTPLEQQLAASLVERDELLQQQAASEEILKTINASRGDLAPVFDLILEKAHSLCDVTSGSLQLLEGDYIRAVAVRGMNAAFETFLREGYRVSEEMRSDLDSVTPQNMDVVKRLEQNPDHTATRATIELGGLRTLLSVPLRKDGISIGRITAARRDVRPFTDRHIALLQSFADQAVLAIENARLLTEQREALERQTAMAEVLKTISEFSSDLSPVFSSILEKATHICGAAFGVLFQLEETKLRPAASIGVPPAYADYMQTRQGFSPDEGTPLQRVLQTAAPVYTADDTLEPRPGPAARYGGARSLIAVPIMKDDRIVGALVIYRTEVRPFTARQLELVSIFASQAGVAIENARLFEEVQERTKQLSASLDDLRAAQDRLVQTEKLASLGQLTAGIAHEIKNPLNFVNNFAALSAELIDELDESLAPAALDRKTRSQINELIELLKSNLEKVVQHGKRADSIVKNMLLHSHEGSSERRSSDINALVEESLDLAYHGARAERPGFNITLQRELDADAGMIELYPQEITRVLLNLISNGFYAMNKRKETDEDTYTPELSATTKSVGKAVEIRIRDNGTGIPTGVKEKMFNPFFTTKPAGEGTGLGLSMSHDIIVKQHRGTIDVTTVPGEFTEFIVTLPRNAAATVQAGGSK